MQSALARSLVQDRRFLASYYKARLVLPWQNGVRVFVGALMKRPNLTPRVQEALRQLLAGPQDMRDEALLELINEELKPASVDDITYVRDRLRFSCPPC